MSRPKISVVIPAHNEAEHLPCVLRSVRRAAQQVDIPVQIIVVDDASEDATGDIAREMGARVERVNLRHIAAVRNAGARVAEGELLVFLDGDTKMSKPLLQKAWEAHRQGCVGGGCRVVMDQPLSRIENAMLTLWSTLSITLRWAAGAFLFVRRDLFEQVGGFDERYFAGEEVLLSIRLKHRGAFVILREPVITSARKLQSHDPREHLRVIVLGALSLGNSLKRREGLELWYGPRGHGSAR